MLHGLACEWESAASILDTPVRDNIRKPLFGLRNMKGRWGYWSSERNEICLSRNLVLNHSWDSVCEILLHEMAHQYAEQFLGARDEHPHGPKFKQACLVLRANPRASGNCVPLDERISNDLTNQEDKMMVRVKKLISLAQSQNQHEAEAAMAKAHELISKYNVDLLSRENHRHFVSVFVGRPALQHSREHYHLSSLLQEFYFVHGIWVPAYVIEKGKMGRVLEISGTEQNVRIASYVHGFIKHFIDSQWENYNRKKGLNRYRKTDFAIGIIEGFRSKLKSQNEKERNIRNKRGLIKIKDPQLERYTDYKYPHTINMQGRTLKNDKHVFQDGITIGKKLVIYKGLSQRGKNRMLLNSPS